MLCFMNTKLGHLVKVTRVYYLFSTESKYYTYRSSNFKEYYIAPSFYVNSTFFE